MTIIDIETGPLPNDRLIVPDFKAPANYKDPEKIEAAKKAAEADWRQNLALSATTGQILSVGMIQNDELRVMTDTEPAMLREVWNAWSDNQQWVGFNLLDFDWPFLLQRSWILGITPAPFANVRNNSRLVDLMRVWMTYRPERVSLNTVAQALGLGAKTGYGADFARLFAEDREKAIAYVEQDLRLTEAIARRIL